MSATEWELFRIQAIKAAGLEGHPKANQLYADTWNMFGWCGKAEVLCALCDMAEIVLEEKSHA